jgi:hypothetical protein
MKKDHTTARPHVLLNDRHAQIPKDEIKSHDALRGLSGDFRDSIDWSGPKNPAKGDEFFVAMLRMPQPELSADHEKRLYAADRCTYRGPAQDILPESHQRFWNTQLRGIRPMAIDFVKSGPVIWKFLDLDVPSEQTAEILSLEKIDKVTADAAQSALLSAFNTSVEPADLETIALALSTFIHAHPAFKHLVPDGVFHLPFGPFTVFSLCGGPKSQRKKRRRT